MNADSGGARTTTITFVVAMVCGEQDIVDIA